MSLFSYRCARLIGLSASLCAASVLAQTPAQAPAPAVVAPKVMVITMFDGEAKPWLDNEKLTEKIAVPGLAEKFPDVACNAQGLCLLTTSMGYASAASSVSALIYSHLFDLGKTYFVISGIAGVDPNDGTLGSAHWARYAIDGGLLNVIDARDIDKAWSSGYVGFGAANPNEAPKTKYGTEVYQLDENLLQKAFALTKDTPLVDNDSAATFRKQYSQPAAAGKPMVSICDTLSTDTWWHGARLADAMAMRVKQLTDGHGNYCTTQQEDNATLTALQRGAHAGLLDFKRIAVLRAASNFDREPAGMTPFDSLRARSGGYLSSVTNAYRVSSTLAHTVIRNWGQWQSGTPQ